MLSTYYTPVEDYEEIKRYADKKTMEKYYPNRDGERLIKIAEDGNPSIQRIFEEYQRYVYEGATVYYTELNQLRDEILQERGKFLKNKNKIAKLSERHREIRKSIAQPCGNLPKSALDKVFLKTFAVYHNTKKRNYTEKMFFNNIGWIQLPPYFFNDSLYDLRNKDFAKYNVKCFIHLLPEASLALITRDLQAEEGDSFFKTGVTANDVYKKVQEQADYERKFAEKFDLNFICGLFADKLQSFQPVPNKAQQELTINLPYMGLDRLDDHALKDVAKQIFEYYNLFTEYAKYEKWFNNGPLAEHLRLARMLQGGSDVDWKRKAANVLPGGEKDIPYFDLYYSLIQSNQYTTLAQVCAHVRKVQEQDELKKTFYEMAENQKKIVRQNDTIIQNQNKLYEQRQKQHSEAMKQAAREHRDIMDKMYEIERKAEKARTDIIIYY